MYISEMESVTLQASEPLDSAGRRRIGHNMPAPLVVRLDSLVAACRAAGVATDRTELLNAAARALPETSAQLVQLLERYRSSSAGDVVLPRQHDGTLLVPPTRPGRVERG